MADDYARHLLSEPASATYAAVQRWPAPLPEWIRTRSLTALYALTGADLTWPWDEEPPPTDEEMALAHRVLEERSAIRD